MANNVAPIPTPFPARTRTASAVIASIPTTVTSISFSDKLMLTISQSGRLNHWIHVPLANASPSVDAPLNQSSGFDDEGEERPDASLLPSSHLTATTVLGGTKPEFEMLGQTLATTVASAVLMRSPDEGRMVVLGLGLEKAELGRDGFEGLVGLCLECL
ncbi:hypothetical protein H2203_006502 [Taxawa tesnikishii (nom. ined.)]|nr:hypothetical protein H2203_006502 [Dothideales sp. JES 119]